MICNHCEQELTVSNFTMLEGNTSGKQTLVCTNPNCTIYCGNDLCNPKQIASTRVIDLKHEL